MTVYVLGNPEIEEDSLPLRILPKLREALPEINFEIKDPNEDWGVDDSFILIDTVRGIEDVTVFETLSAFTRTKSVTMHDFDVFLNLMFLEKLGMLMEYKIVGVPPTMNEDEAFEKVVATIRPS